MPWYYRENDQSRGPISSADLQQKARQGIVLPTTLVSRDEAKWVRAAEVKGLEFESGSELSVEPSAVRAAQPPPIAVQRPVFRCPQCGDDHIQKVSVIVETGTTASQGTSIGVASLVGGDASAVGSAFSSSKNQTALAKRLAPPQRTKETDPETRLMLATILWACFFAVLVVFIASISSGPAYRNPNQRSSVTPLLVGVCLLIAAVIPLAYLVWLTVKKQPEFQARRKRLESEYQDRLAAWEGTYFCHRCGHTFLL